MPHKKQRGFCFDGSVTVLNPPLELIDPAYIEELERLAPDYEFARMALELLRDNAELVELDRAARAAKKQAEKSDVPDAEALSDAA